jgi:hypothetical protein
MCVGADSQAHTAIRKANALVGSAFAETTCVIMFNEILLCQRREGDDLAQVKSAEVGRTLQDGPIFPESNHE